MVLMVGTPNTGAPPPPQILEIPNWVALESLLTRALRPLWLAFAAAGCFSQDVLSLEAQIFGGSIDWAVMAELSLRCRNSEAIHYLKKLVCGNLN